MAAVLTSWKEIAAHLGKSIRTVQRWERELGLPVRRPDLRRSGIVLADPDELDAWIHAQAPAAFTNLNGNGHGDAGSEEDASASAIRRSADENFERTRERLHALHRRSQQTMARTQALYENMGLRMGRLREAMQAHQRATESLRRITGKVKGQPAA